MTYDYAREILDADDPSFYVNLPTLADVPCEHADVAADCWKCGK